LRRVREGFTLSLSLSFSLALMSYLMAGTCLQAQSSPVVAGVFNAGSWHVDYNNTGALEPELGESFSLGQSGDIPVAGDWNGSGTDKAGVFRNGWWLLDYNGNGVWDGELIDRMVAFGWAGATPVVGDWNGKRQVQDWDLRRWGLAAGLQRQL
jgi:hypothetical protein